MTVIAWDGKTVAADRLMIEGDLVTEVTKIKRIKYDIVGFVGEYTVGKMLMRWYSCGMQDTEWPGHWQDKEDWWSELVVFPWKRAKAIVYGRTKTAVVYRPYFALGSGREMAIGAMEAGATPKEAVEIVCKRLHSCGGGINVLEEWK